MSGKIEMKIEKTQIYLFFLSLYRIFDFVEDTHARKSKKNFAFCSLTRIFAKTNQKNLRTHV